MKKLYLLSLLLLCSMAFQWENTMNTDENRLALVIGNANYDKNYQDPIDNASNDADAMAEKLEKLGFEVIKRKNLSLDKFNTAADDFNNRVKKLKSSSKPLVTLFYYSGHGMHVNDISYLLPINCKAQQEADLDRKDEYGAYPLHYLTDRLVEHGNFLNIIMLDACRTNKFPRLLAQAKGGDPDGLNGYGSPYKNVKVVTPSPMYYSYATEYGEIAKSGSDDNSPYVKGFLKALEIPNQPLETVLKQTGAYVLKNTNKNQRPQTANKGFYGDFIFHKKEIPKDTDGDGYIDAVDNCIHVYSKTNNGCPDDRTSDPFADLMIRIPSGTFSMGGNEYDNEKPIHSVTLSSFYMSKYEVTQKQWTDIMGTNPSYFKNCDNCPVEEVSWDDIQTFLQKLNTKTGKNYRLPTEAEWEYACRAGTTTTFNTGDNLTTAQANYNGNYPWKNYPKGEYRQKTTPVGSFAPNTWGLYDMHGNVWEWCSDWYGSYSSGAVTNPKGPSTGTHRVLRSGSWGNLADHCRSAYREDYYPGYRNISNGFRLAL